MKILIQKENYEIPFLVKKERVFVFKSTKLPTLPL